MKSRRFQLLYEVLAALLWLAALPASAQYNLAPSFIFVTNNGAITITGYTSSTLSGPDGELDIPASTNGYPVTGISSNAFWECNPTSVSIPNSITNIGEGSFAFCSYLTNIAVDVGNPDYTSVDGVLFNKSLTLLMQYPAGLTADSYIIPSGIVRIGADAFAYCPQLTSVTIPNSVTSIGEAAFTECFSLTNIMIPDGVTNIGEGAFVACRLMNVTIPNSITSISKEVFWACSSLTNVTMGNSITNIGVGAFYGCSSLTSVIIPKSVTDIDAWAFSIDSSLTDIHFLGNAPTVDSSAFSYDSLATAYYLPGRKGWESTLGGIPTALWHHKSRR